MTPKKTPRPKPRKNPNRLSRRSAAKTDKSQTCLHCRYWSMWDGSCATRAAACILQLLLAAYYTLCHFNVL